MATSTGAITSTGIGSGLDVSSIITKLMSVEQQPLKQLQTQAESFNTQLSTFGKLQSNMSTLRDKANALVAPSLWTGTSATVSDTASLKVTTGSNAVAGSYAVQVDRLASSQTLASAAFASSGSGFGAGTLSIELGSYAADGAFSAKSGASAVSISVGEGATLAELRDKINAAGAGVVAAIVTDASGARLTMRSTATGAENAFRITASETSDDGDAATGLSALAYDAAVADSPMGRTAEAANAQVKVNGISISTAGNTLDNVIDGLTLDLAKVTTAPVSVEVKADTESIKTAITDFVTAFNAVASFIKTQTAYDQETKKGGTLQGDATTLSLQAQLRNVVNQGSSASSAFSRLSDIGIALKADGTLETKTGKLDSALTNLAETRKLLAADGADNAATGFVRRFKVLADATLGSEGFFDSRSAGLRSRLDRNTKAQDAQQLRLEKVQARLQAQYSSLDTTMAQLSGLSSYVSQQVTLLNKS